MEWCVQNGDIMPVWFGGNQFPPSVGKGHPKKPRDGNIDDQVINVGSKQTKAKRIINSGAEFFGRLVETSGARVHPEKTWTAFIY